MADYSQFPPESTDNTPLVYYFPSYFSLQETVTSAKINSLIKCYNTLIEKFMQHNHTEGLNAYDEKTRAVKLAACACLVDGSIFTQCLANGCVTDEKIDTLDYSKVFVNLNTNYFLDDKISDMDTEISLRVHLNNNNTITASNIFTGTNIFTTSASDINQHTFDFSDIVFNKNVEFNNNMNVNGTSVFVSSPKVPNLNISTNDDSAANTKFVHDLIDNAVQVIPTSSNVTLKYKTVTNNGSSAWNSSNYNYSGYDSDNPITKSNSYKIVEFKVGENSYKIPTIANSDNNTMYVMCHTSCHCHCHGNCRGGSH